MSGPTRPPVGVSTRVGLRGDYVTNCHGLSVNGLNYESMVKFDSLGESNINIYNSSYWLNITVYDSRCRFDC